MNALIGSKIHNLLLLITIIGEFLLPWILKHFYKDYNGKTMVMSALGSPESPVRKIYNVWLVWLGGFLLFTSFLLFVKVNIISSILAILTFISVAIFAVGAGILSGLFSVNKAKEKVTASSKIHGVGSAIGFMTFLFFPLLQSIGAFMSNDVMRGIVCIISFVFAFLFFSFLLWVIKKSLRILSFLMKVFGND